MLTFIPLLVAGILIAIGLFLIIWGKVTLRPGRRKVMDSQGQMRNSFSMRATRGLGLIFILGGVLTILGVFHLFRSEEHTSELQSLMRISYAVFCLKKNK